MEDVWINNKSVLILEAETVKIEWSQVDRGKHLIQELKDEQSTDEQWSGFGMGSNVGDRLGLKTEYYLLHTYI